MAAGKSDMPLLLPRIDGDGVAHGGVGRAGHAPGGATSSRVWLGRRGDRRRGGVPRRRRARSLGRDALGLELPYLVDDVAGDVALAARRQLFEQLVQEARQRGGLVAHTVQV